MVDNDIANSVSYDDLLSAVDPELVQFFESSDMLMASESCSTNKVRDEGDSKRIIKKTCRFSSEGGVDDGIIVDTSYETRSVDFLDLAIRKIESSNCNSVRFFLSIFGCGCEALDEEEVRLSLEPMKEFSLEEAEQVEDNSGFLPVSSDKIAQPAHGRNIEYLGDGDWSGEDVAYSFSWDHSFIYDNPFALKIGPEPLSIDCKNDDISYIRRFVSGDSSVSSHSSSNTSTLSQELEYCDATFLYLALEQRQWEVVTHRLRNHPDEAAVWIFQEDNEERSGWKILPLHAACIFGASSHVVKALIDAFPQAVNEPDLGGRLPLHLALYTCISAEVVRDLLAASPSTINARDRTGKLPVVLAESSTGVARSEILQILDFGILNNDDSCKTQYAPTPFRSENTKYSKKYHHTGLGRKKKKIPFLNLFYKILKRRGA